MSFETIHKEFLAKCFRENMLFSMRPDESRCIQSICHNEIRKEAFFRVIGVKLSVINTKNPKNVKFARIILKDVKVAFGWLKNSSILKILKAVNMGGDMNILPVFIKSEKCPDSLIKAFLQGLFLGKQLENNTVRLFSIEGTERYSDVRSKTCILQEYIYLTELLKKFGINAAIIDNGPVLYIQPPYDIFHRDILTSC